MGNTSNVSELKAVMLIKRFRHDLERNFGQMVEVVYLGKTSRLHGSSRIAEVEFK